MQSLRRKYSFLTRWPLTWQDRSPAIWIVSGDLLVVVIP